MILIGEKINGVIPAVKAAIETRNPDEIVRRVRAQEQAGAAFLDCAPSTDTALEYDAMGSWKIICISVRSRASCFLESLPEMSMTIFSASYIADQRPEASVASLPVVQSAILLS